MNKRQMEVYWFVCYYIRNHGYSPTLRDIVAGVGIKSTSSVAYDLDMLHGEGLLVRTRGESRGISLTDKNPIMGRILTKGRVTGYIVKKDEEVYYFKLQDRKTLAGQERGSREGVTGAVR